MLLKYEGTYKNNMSSENWWHIKEIGRQNRVKFY